MHISTACVWRRSKTSDEVLDSASGRARFEGLVRVLDAGSGDILHERKLPATSLESGGPPPHPAPPPALVATPKYVYARIFGDPAITWRDDLRVVRGPDGAGPSIAALTVVFSNDADFKQVWRFSVKDASPCDAFEEDTHFLRTGRRNRGHRPVEDDAHPRQCHMAA